MSAQEQTIQDVLQEAVNLAKVAITLGFTPQYVHTSHHPDAPPSYSRGVELHYQDATRAEDVAKALDLTEPEVHTYPPGDGGGRTFAVAKSEHNGTRIEIFGQP